MEKFDTLDEGISVKKKKIINDVDKNKKLLLISYLLVIVLLILIFYIYKKYSKLLDRINQIEKNTTQSFKETKTHSERIKNIRETMRDYADQVDKQKGYNQKTNDKIKEIENKIELLKLNNEKMEKIINENVYKNEIICKYEINDIEKEILLFNYENRVVNFPDWNKLEGYKQNIELYLDGKRIKTDNIFKAKKPGIYKVTFKFLKHMNDISKLFHECKNLIYVDLSNFKSENLTDISYLFSKWITKFKY